MNQFNSEDISNKKFNSGFRGYDKSQVDSYLQILASEFKILESRIIDLENKILEQKIIKYEEMETMQIHKANAINSFLLLRPVPA